MHSITSRSSIKATMRISFWHFGQRSGSRIAKKLGRALTACESIGFADRPIELSAELLGLAYGFGVPEARNTAGHPESKPMMVGRYGAASPSGGTDDQYMVYHAAWRW